MRWLVTSHLIRIYTVCHSGLDFRLKPLFEWVGRPKYMARRVHLQKLGNKWDKQEHVYFSFVVTWETSPDPSMTSLPSTTLPPGVIVVNHIKYIQVQDYCDLARDRMCPSTCDHLPSVMQNGTACTQCDCKGEPTCILIRSLVPKSGKIIWYTDTPTPYRGCGGGGGWGERGEAAG